MKSLKRLVVLATFMLAALTSEYKADAAEYCSTVAGCGYQECCAAPCLTPSIALATVGLAAIILVALQHSHGQTGHNHSHCD